jgi:hypothetical protein
MRFDAGASSSGVSSSGASGSSQGDAQAPLPMCEQGVRSFQAQSASDAGAPVDGGVMYDGTVDLLAGTREYLAWGKRGAGLPSVCLKSSCFGNGRRYEMETTAAADNVVAMVASENQFYFSARTASAPAGDKYLLRSQIRSSSPAGVSPVSIGFSGNIQSPAVLGPNNGGVAYVDDGKWGNFKANDVISCVDGSGGCKAESNNVIVTRDLADVRLITRVFGDVGAAGLNLWYWQRGDKIFAYTVMGPLDPVALPKPINVLKFSLDRATGDLAWIETNGDIRVKDLDALIGKVKDPNATDLIVAGGQIVWIDGTQLLSCGVKGCNSVSRLLDSRDNGGSGGSLQAITADTQYVYAATSGVRATIYRAPLPNCK